MSKPESATRGGLNARDNARDGRGGGARGSSLAAALLSALALACGPAKTIPEAPPAPLQEAEPPPAAPDLPLHLVGEVVVPGQGSLAFFARIEGSAEEPTGVLNIPSQGAQDVPLSDVTLSGEEVQFGVSAVQARWRGRFAGDDIECFFEQAGNAFECSMESVDEEAFEQARAPDRPQQPEPPFPYDSEEVTVEGDGNVQTGTLSLPPGSGHAAVLLLSGSGAQDRDATILGHQPFFVIADHLTRNGIAVLRLDDRGVGGSSGDAQTAVIEELRTDAARAVEYLKTRAPRIDPKKIGLLGHSEGANVAAATAAANKDVAFVILLAGPGVTGGDLVVDQVKALLGASGAPAPHVEQAASIQAQVVAALVKKQSDEDRRKEVTALIDPTGAGGAALQSQVEAVLTPWFRAFLKHDPAVNLRKLKIPVLALFAEKDLQVTPSLNEPAMTKALARNKKAEIETLGGLNHLFQSANTGLPTEYGNISETISPVALERIQTFIAEL